MKRTLRLSKQGKRLSRSRSSVCRPDRKRYVPFAVSSYTILTTITAGVTLCCGTPRGWLVLSTLSTSASLAGGCLSRRAATGSTEGVCSPGWGVRGQSLQRRGGASARCSADAEQCGLELARDTDYGFCFIEIVSHSSGVADWVIIAMILTIKLSTAHF